MASLGATLCERWQRQVEEVGGGGQPHIGIKFGRRGPRRALGVAGAEKQAEPSLEAFMCFLAPGSWKATRGAGETAQWEKVLAVKPDDTSSILYRGPT